MVRFRRDREAVGTASQLTHEKEGRFWHPSRQFTDRYQRARTPPELPLPFVLEGVVVVGVVDGVDSGVVVAGAVF